LTPAQKAEALKAIAAANHQATQIRGGTHLTPAEQAAALQGIAGANAQAQQIRDTYTMPPMGGKADLHLFSPAPEQGVRPFAPGEFVQNPDASWSSERSLTVQDPRLNKGKWSVIPSIYLKNGSPYEAKDEDEAVKLAGQTGYQWRSFPDLKTADQFSIDRENEWQKFEKPEDARSVAPLYSSPLATVAGGPK
jgi:hypothetical protein